MGLALNIGEGTTRQRREIISGCWKKTDTGLSSQISGRSRVLRPFQLRLRETPVGLLLPSRLEN